MDEATPLERKQNLIAQICCRSDLSESELRVAVVLLNNFHNTASGRCNPGISALMKATTLCRSAILASIKKLETKQILRRSSGGGSATNAYEFLSLDRYTPTDRSTAMDRSTAANGTGPRPRTPPVRGRGRDRSVGVDPNREENRERNREKNRVARKTKSVRSEIAEDAEPSADDQAHAERMGMTEPVLRFEWQKFRDHHLKIGSAFASWPAAWRTWCSGWIERGGARQARRGAPTMSEMAHMDQPGFSFADCRRPGPSSDGIAEAREALRNRPTRGTASALAGIDSFFEKKK